MRSDEAAAAAPGVEERKYSGENDGEVEGGGVAVRRQEGLVVGGGAAQVTVQELQQAQGRGVQLTGQALQHLLSPARPASSQRPPRLSSCLRCSGIVLLNIT